MNWFGHFQKFQRAYEIGVATLFLSLTAAVSATTRIMDDRRINQEPSFRAWEPFVWEFSSLVLWFALVPLVVVFIQSNLCSWRNIARTLVSFAGVSLVFSALHVGGMVLLRKAVYWSQNRVYSFGDIGYEFFYEYRKDILTLIFIITLIQSYRFIVSRLWGEANIVTNGEDDPRSTSSDRILVKKLGKEFIVKISDIEWLEACGNYVNLHVKERIYPTRNTLTRLMAEIADQGFCRVHRSFAVNLDAVESIETQPSGSGDVSLKNGRVLSLSRRYHDELKQRLY